MDEQPAALAGAVASLRMLADGDVSVTITFQGQDRKAVMEMLGTPGQPVAVAALKAGHAAKSAGPTATYADLGPICREAIDMCANPRFQEWVARPTVGRPTWKTGPDPAKGYILAQCGVDSRKQLDTAEGARELFIEHVRKPFHAWLGKQ